MNAKIRLEERIKMFEESHTNNADWNDLANLTKLLLEYIDQKDKPSIGYKK